MTASILVCRRVFADVVARLREHFEVESNDADDVWSRDELIRRLQGKDGVFVTGTQAIDAALLDACPQLRAVCSLAVGYNNIDVPACTARGVAVTNAPGVLTETTADFGFALVMAAARRISESEAFLRRGEWSKWSVDLFAGSDVHGATLGILGMGRIGQAIARRLDASLVPVVYHSRNPSKDVSYKHYPDLIEMAKAVDTLMVIVPGGASTNKMINAEVLKALGPRGVLVNVARGSVVDEAALVQALKSGTILAAGLDVFAAEPSVPDELKTMQNVVLLPHIGSASVVTRNAMDQLVVDNLKSWFAGKAPLTPVAETPFKGR
jgi:lactate dehydrogenase-like 2-hydroxyacid dehydrogenase